MMQKRLLIWLPFLILLTSCGFYLHGLGPKSATYSLSSIYIANPQNLVVGVLIKEAAAYKRIKIVPSAKSATVDLTIVRETFNKMPLNYAMDGSVSQYRLTYTLYYQINKPQHPAGQLTLTRDMDYSNKEILGKEAEVQSLKANMEKDSASRVLDTMLYVVSAQQNVSLKTQRKQRRSKERKPPNKSVNQTKANNRDGNQASR